MLVRRIPFVLSAAIAPVVAVLPAQPARADYVMTSSFDKEVVHPGETVALKATFTNPETVPVMFTFTTVNTSFITIDNRVAFKRTSCTGEIVDCDHFTAPIPPGASRTMTLTFQVAPDSACDGNALLQFYFYNYRESAAGAVESIVGTGSSWVRC